MLAGRKDLDDVVAHRRARSAPATASTACSRGSGRHGRRTGRGPTAARRSRHDGVYADDLDFLATPSSRSSTTPGAPPADGGVAWREHRQPRRSSSSCRRADLRQRLEVLPQSYLAERKVTERLQLATSTAARQAGARRRRARRVDVARGPRPTTSARCTRSRLGQRPRAGVAGPQRGLRRRAATSTQPDASCCTAPSRTSAARWSPRRTSSCGSPTRPTPTSRCRSRSTTLREALDGDRASAGALINPGPLADADGLDALRRARRRAGRAHDARWRRSTRPQQTRARPGRARGRRASSDWDARGRRADPALEIKRRGASRVERGAAMVARRCCPTSSSVRPLLVVVPPDAGTTPEGRP